MIAHAQAYFLSSDLPTKVLLLPKFGESEKKELNQFLDSNQLPFTITTPAQGSTEEVDDADG